MPILIRDREVLEAIITPESDGNRCTYCEKPIVQGRFHWNDEHGEPVRSHSSHGGDIQSFPDWRHVDGTPGHGADLVSLVLPKDRCPSCRAFDSIDIRDTGYGSDCTCTACGWHTYYDRGD